MMEKSIKMDDLGYHYSWKHPHPEIPGKKLMVKLKLLTKKYQKSGYNMFEKNI